MAQQYHDGGWPHQLAVNAASSSIVATAQVIEILRIFHHDYESDEIQAGLNFLAEQVEFHTQPVTGVGRGRGERTRFPVFALWGLTRFPRAPYEPRHQAGLAFVMQWLLDNQLTGGGWPVDKEHDELSFTMTAPAIDALDRLEFHAVYGEQARMMAHEARAAIASRAHSDGRGLSWWTPYADSDDPSPAGTIHAVLALTKGDAEHRELARRGVSWLMAYPAGWVEEVEWDKQLSDRLWTIMSFSLGLRAVLNPCTGVRATDERLRPAIEHLSKLWVETSEGPDPVCGWADYEDGFPTTTGCFAVVMAVRALKRAHPFDPERDIPAAVAAASDEAGPDDPRQRELHSPFRLTLYRAERLVEVTETKTGSSFRCKLHEPSEWAILEMLAQRHVTTKGRDLMTQSIPVEELAAKRQVPLLEALDIIAAVNTQLISASRHAGGHFLPQLVEQIVPGETDENRYGFERVDVRILERLAA